MVTVHVRVNGCFTTRRNNDRMGFVVSAKPPRQPGCNHVHLSGPGTAVVAVGGPHPPPKKTTSSNAGMGQEIRAAAGCQIYRF